MTSTLGGDRAMHLISGRGANRRTDAFKGLKNRALRVALIALISAGHAHAQEFARVQLTPAARLPSVSSESVYTTVDMGLSQTAAAQPWTVALSFTDRTATDRTATDGIAEPGALNYELRLTNASRQPLSIPVGNHGDAIWQACQREEIAELSIVLRDAGAVYPLAMLPGPHACAALSSSSLTIAPGAWVTFHGSVAGHFASARVIAVAAVVTRCSSTYSFTGSEPQAARHCDAPMTSTPVTPPKTERALSMSPVR